MALTSAGSGLRRFESVPHLLEELDPSYPVFCIWPEVLRERARQFVEGFAGRTLYAVKCNDHPVIMKTLYEAGITAFDTASLPEIAMTRELFPDADCYFNHPVKGRAALEAAAREYGMRDYVVDHVSELTKIHETIPHLLDKPPVIEVRLATSGDTALFNLSEKFGCSPVEAVDLLRQAVDLGFEVALCFHVGSQCTSPNAYAEAIKMAASVRDAAGVTLNYLDIGGGFPAAYEEEVSPLEEFFAVIEQARKTYGFDCPLLAEPGRALVADACSVVTQVNLRKGSAVYLNEGFYGTLAEIKLGQLRVPSDVYPRGRTHRNVEETFSLFGPTCDCLDGVDLPFQFPADIEEGDWIAFHRMGAYSLTLATGFNGFRTDMIVEMAGWPEWIPRHT